MPDWLLSALAAALVTTPYFIALIRDHKGRDAAYDRGVKHGREDMYVAMIVQADIIDPMFRQRLVAAMGMWNWHERTHPAPDEQRS